MRVRQHLVDVHEHRVLLAGLIAGRQRQRRLQLLALAVREVDEHALAPRVVRDLRIRVGDLARRGERRVAHPVVGELLERLLREDQTVRVFRLLHAADALVGPDERRRLAAARGRAPVAGLLRPVAVRRERLRLREIDAVISAAASTAAASTPAAAGRAESREPQLHLLGGAGACGQVRALAAVERLRPDVVLVVEQDRLAVLRPAGDAPDRLLSREVVVSVDEARGARVDTPDFAGLEVVGHHVLVLEVQEPLAVRRRAHRAQHALRDQRARTRGGVDLVVVAARRLALGEIVIVRRRIAPDRPAIVRRRRDGPDRVVGQPEELFRRHGHDARERCAPRLAHADDLLGLQVDVLPVIDVEIRLRLAVLGP